MSHGHHAEHGGGEGHGNKKIAIFIAVLAALLAIAEAGGKSAQTAALFHNIDATNLWQFFQAKTIRRTALQVGRSVLEYTGAEGLPANIAEGRRKQVEQWREDIRRYESEPETQEGRQELMKRAKAQEELRDRSMAAYHLYELSSASFQIAIVLASATIITGAAWLIYVGGALSAIGIVLSAVAWLAPIAIHL
ncbi:MAG: DUF4337 domain-containing protein [Alphaproteobacteria bacterium]|nr:DUF4337 domain-containing protein [Alphaproteobacteria bacterium]